MKRDCPIVLNKCVGADSPVTNASSEAPDPLLFAGVGWTLYDPYRPIPLGGGDYILQDCSNITWSAESQELADLLAFINAQFCETPAPPPIPGVPPLPVPFPVNNTNPFIRPPVGPTFTEEVTREFTNDRQFAQVTCPNGAVFEMAIEAGAVIGGPFPEAVGLAWVEYINAYLLAWILNQLYEQRVCIDILDVDDRTEPGVPPTPPPPPGGSPSTIASHPGWVCLGSALPTGQFTYNISGGSASAVWVFSLSAGALAPGTALVQTGPRSAVVTGTPSTAGVYTFTIMATSGSTSISVSDTLHVFGLTTNALPDGEVGTAYSEQLQVDGGTAPYTFSGSAPAGLTLSSNGTISGDPNAEGTFTFSVTVTDANGASCSTDVSLVVAASCPDWDSVVWPAPFIIQVGGGVAIASAIGGVFSAHSSAPVPSPGPSRAAAIYQLGTITAYSGTGCNCILTVTHSKTGTSNCYVVINRLVPFATLLLANFTPLPDAIGQVFPFVVPDCSGTPSNITIEVYTSCGYAAGSTLSEIDGTITNV